MRRRLGDEELVAAFKQQSALFGRGELQASAYHAYAAALGLAPLIPEIASLLPDANRRADLLAAHRSAFTAEPAEHHDNRCAFPCYVTDFLSASDLHDVYSLSRMSRCPE